MAYFSGPDFLALTGSNGSTTHNAVREPADLFGKAFQFVVEAVGATPTITFKIQGSLDNVNWTDIPYFPANTDVAATAAQTVTATGTTVFFLDSQSDARFFQYYRCVTSANTNVTYRCELYGKAQN